MSAIGGSQEEITAVGDLRRSAKNGSSLFHGS